MRVKPGKNAPLLQHDFALKPETSIQANPRDFGVSTSPNLGPGTG
jgi:hypothetical protein